MLAAASALAMVLLGPQLASGRPGLAVPGPGASSPVHSTFEPPPAELACLAKHYPLTFAKEDGQWMAALPDGTRLRWDDGRPKTFAERLEQPDLQDIFIARYTPGPIRPVEREDDDPGRVRVEALLRAAYGGSDVAKHQVRVRFLGMAVRIHKAIVPPLMRVAARLAFARAKDPQLDPFLRRLSGGYSARAIAGTTRTSPHAYGIAIDLDTAVSDYWRWQKSPPIRWRNRIPQAIVDAFEAEHFIWGGRWHHYDTMHFEYRPELFAPCPERTASASTAQDGVFTCARRPDSPCR